MWTLLRLRDNGATRDQLLVVYIARIRSIMDYCAPVYAGLLNGSQVQKLESVQRLAVAIIMGAEATSYAQGLHSLKLTTLEARRLYMAKVFALKCAKSHRFKHFFTPYPERQTQTPLRYPLLTRPENQPQTTLRYLAPLSRNKRGEGAPPTYLATLLNGLADSGFESGNNE